MYTDLGLLWSERRIGGGQGFRYCLGGYPNSETWCFVLLGDKSTAFIISRFIWLLKDPQSRSLMWDEKKLNLNSRHYRCNRKNTCFWTRESEVSLLLPLPVRWSWRRYWTFPSLIANLQNKENISWRRWDNAQNILYERCFKEKESITSVLWDWGNGRWSLSTHSMWQGTLAINSLHCVPLCVSSLRRTLRSAFHKGSLHNLKTQLWYF